MSKQKNAFETFKERMIALGKVKVLPKDSLLRDILGIPYTEVEPAEIKED